MEQNAIKLSQTLRQMRGAALKLGQVLSIQEDNLIPAHIREAFTNARDFSFKMPDWQLENLMNEELGTEWQTQKFVSFEMNPFAAASIGQVHKATLSENGSEAEGITKTNLKEVAVKVQYPGVLNSIDSDLDSLKMLVTYLNLLPKSFYLDEFLLNTRKELKEECDYSLESRKQNLYRALLAEYSDLNFFKVPKIIGNLNFQLISIQVLLGQFY